MNRFQYDSHSQHLKNHTEGGEGLIGFKHSDKTKKMKSLQVLGTNNPFYNKTHSQEAKDKISKANKNKKMSEEFCNKRSQYMKANPIAKETYQKIAEANKIKVAQYDLDMNLIKIHDSFILSFLIDI